MHLQYVAYILNSAV